MSEKRTSRFASVPWDEEKGFGVVTAVPDNAYAYAVLQIFSINAEQVIGMQSVVKDFEKENEFNEFMDDVAQRTKSMAEISDLLIPHLKDDPYQNIVSCCVYAMPGPRAGFVIPNIFEGVALSTKFASHIWNENGHTIKGICENAYAYAVVGMSSYGNNHVANQLDLKSLLDKDAFNTFMKEVTPYQRNAEELGRVAIRSVQGGEPLADIERFTIHTIPGNEYKIR